MKPIETLLPSPLNTVSQIGLSRNTTHVARGIDHAPTTQVLLLDDEEALTFITRCRNIVTNVI